MSAANTARVLGIGSPIVDCLAQVPESHLESVGGEKGGMELVGAAEMAALLEGLAAPPAIAAGGSAGNTTFALARLGMPCAFLGKLGDDGAGQSYRDAFVADGGDAGRFKWSAEAPTAQCLSLITPDSERTLRTHLGAAMSLSAEEVTQEDFAGIAHAHIEGYLLFNRDLALKVLSTAKEAGCTVSLDLGSFEVVGAARDILDDLLTKYVDAVFANEDEAEAFCGSKEPGTGLDALSAFCDTAVVKVGPAGAYLKRGGEQVYVPACTLAKERVLDTTGAGDLWAAGFLYGHLNGRPLEVCGKMGAILGAEIVQVIGASLDDAAWARVTRAFAEL